MARNRPGKRERLANARNAFQTERNAIIAANLREARPDRPVYGGPKGLRNSVLARDNLKSASHDIGFIGPRGYHTPTDKVGKREAAPGMLASRRTAKDRAEALALAATVNLERPTQKS